MLHKASLAKELLTPASKDRITGFVLSQINPDGGFKDRSGQSDLYYSLFGLYCLILLGVSPKNNILHRIRCYLTSFGHGEALDFVHLISLLQSRWAVNILKMPVGLQHRIIRDYTTGFFIKMLYWFYTYRKRRDLQRIESYRTVDGGYSLTSEERTTGSIYAAFLATLAYLDDERNLPNYLGLINFIYSKKCSDGGFGDTAGTSGGTTTVTAAAVILLDRYDQPIEPSTKQWLIDRSHPHGGFTGNTLTAHPDLLSTATALLALQVIGYPLEYMRRAHLDYLETSWDESGGFGGHEADPTPDCEYTFYALLALGILGVDRH